MQERCYISSIPSIQDTVVLQGWVHSIRDHGKLLFFDLRDTTGVCQCIIKQDHPSFSLAQTLRPEGVVKIIGTPQKKKGSEGNAISSYEIKIDTLTIYANAEELPFDKDAELNIDTELDYRPLTLRTATNSAISRIQATITHAYREALIDNKFIEIHPPKLVGEDAEGGAAVFSVPYFHNVNASLATSPQLYKQIMTGVHERVFSVGSVFRGEKHATTRHLNEYVSFDFEMGFIDNYKDITKMTEKVIRHIIQSVEKKHSKELEMMQITLPRIPQKEFPHLSFTEAQKVLKNTDERVDISHEEEAQLTAYAEKEYNSSFIFITHYPLKKRPFYTMPSQDNIFSEGFDLICGHEIVTGGQRIHNYEDLKNSITKKNLSVEDFSFYLQAFKYGMPPHGGIGLGLERLTSALLKLQNIRQASPFPRDINRIDKRLTS